MRLSCGLFVVAVLCGMAIPRARADAPDEDIPLVGRPADLPFSGASASFVVLPGPEYHVPFRAQTVADRTRLEAQSPLRFTVNIIAQGRVHRPPARIDLREVPAFNRAFYIEDVVDGNKEQIAATAWRWVYRLKPRGAWVDEIPAVPFVFYNPDLRPVEKAFQVIWTDAVPLTVEPPEPPPVPLDLPESMMTLAGGPGVLAQRQPWRLPGAVVLAMMLAAPPLACLIWYRLWRRRYPDAARSAQMRRSWAARRALRLLDAAPAEPGSPRGDHVAGVLADYLRERFDRAPAEPTPAEAADLLRRHGCPAELVERIDRLLRACAAERFPPIPIEQIDVVEQARSFILAVEDLQ
jgi:hypothetical protein